MHCGRRSAGPPNRWRASDGLDEVAALESVRALSDAMPALTELLGRVPALLQAADPGPDVTKRIAGYRAELSRQLAELAVHRTALEEAAELRQQIADAGRERELLRGEIGKLDRGRQVMAELPGLRARREQLQAAVDDAEVQVGEQAVRGLTEDVRELLRQLAGQQAVLGAELADLAADVAAADQEITAETRRRDQLAGELAARQTAAGELRDEIQQTLPALDLHRQADRDLADALDAAGLVAAGQQPGDSRQAGEPADSAGIPPAGTGLAAVRTALASIDEQIGTADSLLKPLLARHAQAYQDATAVRPWAGRR